MRLAATSVLAALLQAAPCAHPVRGESRPVRLDAVARAHREARRALTLEVRRAAAGDPLAQPFESGLPACRGRARRIGRVEEVPAELVGRAVHFGPRPREGAIHAVTSARSLLEASGAVLAGPELAHRLGVRCAPSTVRVRAAGEVEIDEGD
jgi:hypothetical protein